MKVKSKNGSGSFILLPWAHYKSNPNGNAHWKADYIGNPNDTKFIMEKIGIHIKLQQYFQYWLNISELKQRDFSIFLNDL